ncbi:class I SAM-dependent RNA methyltransferase [Phragmitibacter flavus]|uniref:Class I SAM-dependent RNA methyltransferase n=1 Tax=Phragmitibacter flavus TaxID=2576071 RepID=A0A5R8KD45_9BACT|nr:class I SAM-dependent RNA methyltransferase [Phragmitibacter flavus]TLD70167.1 class I SAM-dependent RNA methyltransferase [Phragmitibacter flavus]
MSESPTPSAPKKFNPVPFAYHEELTLDIEKLTNLAQGIARVNGWVVMVPFALPGERVLARIYRNHKNYSDADLIRVINPSPDRIDPRCPLFGTCGGCQYQNLHYDTQLTWKQQQVAELLKHMGGIEHPVEPVIPSPTQFNYRSKITPHFQQPRNGQIAEIGFLANASRHRIIDVPHCDIAMTQINEKLPVIRADVRANPQRYKRAATLLMRASQEHVLTESGHIAVEIVNGIRFEFKAGDFFQNNPYILPAFVDHVGREAAASGATHLLDTYCGSGLFALTCAKHFQSVTGIEISESAAARAAHNAQINQITHATFQAGSAEHIFKDITHPASDTAVIVDPPRAGCGDAFLDQLFAFGPRSVVYVSCNPATQMRDLTKFLQSGYTLEKVQPFDLFPQTRHLECVMTLVKTSTPTTATR